MIADRTKYAIGIWVALAMVFPTPSILSAQAANSRSISGPSDFLNSLSTFAQSADSPTGELNYATRLIGMMGPHISQGDIDLLARRLASADQAARHDSRKYIPGSAIAAAFNGLMATAQKSYGKSFRTDAQMVHRIRLVLAGHSSTLTSVREHPTVCLPDEAVLLTFLLKYNNGAVIVVPRGQPTPLLGTGARVEDAAGNAGIRLDTYLSAHSTKTNLTLFSKLLRDMGIQP